MVDLALSIALINIKRNADAKLPELSVIYFLSSDYILVFLESGTSTKTLLI